MNKSVSSFCASSKLMLKRCSTVQKMLNIFLLVKTGKCWCIRLPLDQCWCMEMKAGQLHRNRKAISVRWKWECSGMSTNQTGKTVSQMTAYGKWRKWRQMLWVWGGDDFNGIDMSVEQKERTLEWWQRWEYRGREK